MQERLFPIEADSNHHILVEHDEVIVFSVRQSACSAAIHLTIKEGITAQVCLTITEPADSCVKLSLESVVEAHASLTWHVSSTVKRPVHLTLQSTVVGNDGMSAVNMACVSSENVPQAMRITNTFSAVNGRGEMMLRGVARETSKMNIHGKIDIGLHGGGTDTYLTENVLMLSGDAKVDAVPALEIRTNDVKASHSATISRIGEEELFYLASRGISEEQAKEMIVQGFLDDVLCRSPLYTPTP